MISSPLLVSENAGNRDDRGNYSAAKTLGETDACKRMTWSGGKDLSVEGKKRTNHDTESRWYHRLFIKEHDLSYRHTISISIG